MRRIFITGGTGTIGRALVQYILAETKHDCVVYSRDEFKQWSMQTEIKDSRVRYMLGDVRDRNQVIASMTGCTDVIHTAALKHVWSGEQHPKEVIRTNVLGTENVVDAANHHKARMVLISSDKAVAPANLYGATKMVAEALTVNGGQRVVRFGNIFGSRGSVLHKFAEWAAKGHKFKITDRRMTRFVIMPEDAVKFILRNLDSEPGSINYPRLPAIKITDLALAFDDNAEIEEIGMFPGEKLHESLDYGYSSEDAEKLSIDQIRELIGRTL